MADPHGPGLSERVGPDDDVSIVVTDVTRATPDDVLVDLLVADLREAGVERDRIAVVVGLGLHRPMTDDELRTALGEYADLAENHDAEAAEVVGEVEGPDGESLIRYTHGPAMFAREGVRLGGVDGNPFRETLDRTGDRIGLDFCLNVTHGPAGFLGAGDHRDLVLDLTEVCKSNLSVALDDSYDAVVAGVGAPKDANLYQATRAATYVALGESDPLRDDGRIVVPARLQEGAGEGRGERRFYDRLRGAESAEQLYEEMRRGYEPGAQRAFVVARVLREYDLYITNSEAPDVVEDCLMHARKSVEDAVEPGSDVLIVPSVLDTLLVSK